MSYIIWLVVGYFIGYACINFIRWLCSPDSTVQESKEEIKATKTKSTEDHSEDSDEMVVPTKECFAPRKPDPRYGYWIRPNVFKEYAEEDLLDIGIALSALSNVKSANIPGIKKLLLFDALAHFFNFETQVDTGIAVFHGFNYFIWFEFCQSENDVDAANVNIYRHSIKQECPGDPRPDFESSITKDYEKYGILMPEFSRVVPIYELSNWLNNFKELDKKITRAVSKEPDCSKLLIWKDPDEPKENKEVETEEDSED